MDQGGASIHRRKDLFPLKPPLEQKTSQKSMSFLLFTLN